MKKLLLIMLLLLLFNSLFAGAFYPEISLNQSLKLLLDKNANFKYIYNNQQNSDQKNPLYAFSYFPWSLKIEYIDRNNPYLTFSINKTTVIPRLINTLYKASQIKNHKNASSIINFIIERSENTRHKKFDKLQQQLMRVWINKMAHIRRIVFSFIKNSSIDAPTIDLLYKKKWITKNKHYTEITRFRKQLARNKYLLDTSYEWLLDNDKKNTDIYQTSNLLLEWLDLKWLRDKDAGKTENAAEYFLKNLSTIISNTNLSFKASKILKKDRNKYCPDYRKLQNRFFILRIYNNAEEIISTGKFLVKWLTNDNDYRVDSAAKYYLKFLPTIKSNETLSSQITEIVTKKDFNGYMPEYNNLSNYSALQKKLVGNNLLFFMIICLLTLLAVLGYFFIIKKK